MLTVPYEKIAAGIPMRKVKIAGIPLANGCEMGKAGSAMHDSVFVLFKHRKDRVSAPGFRGAFQLIPAFIKP